MITAAELEKEIVTVLDDKKAIDIKSFNISKYGSMYEYVIIASGSSYRQLSTFADALRQNFKSELIGIEGANGSDWVLVDLNSVIVHLFLPETRDIYNLEDVLS
jgi:ribosome-associated protein